MARDGTKTGGGSRKGKPNRATKEFKEALNDMLNFAAPNMLRWLEEIAQDDPAKALEMVNKFIEYAHPKLARVETKTDDTQHEEYMRLLEAMDDKQ